LAKLTRETASLEASDIAMYSVSHVECATVVCLCDIQETGPSFTVNAYPVHDIRSLESDPPTTFLVISIISHGIPILLHQSFINVFDALRLSFASRSKLFQTGIPVYNVNCE